MVKEGAPWCGLQLATEPSLQGVLVGLVSAGSPAEFAGIEPGDFIFQLDGRAVRDGLEVLTEVERVGVGGSLRLGVHRAQSVRLFRIAPVARPATELADASEAALPSAALEGSTAGSPDRDEPN